MIDPNTGQVLSNITCPKCHHRHPAEWTCVFASDVATASKAARLAQAHTEGGDELSKRARGIAVHKLLQRLIDAEVADSWKGGGDPADIPEIEQELREARAAFEDCLVGDEFEADAVRATGLGVTIGVNDRDGNPVHIGDTLEFDAKEWRRGMTFESGVINTPPRSVVELVKGEIVCNGGVGSISDWCRIVKRWDEA